MSDINKLLDQLIAKCDEIGVMRIEFMRIKRELNEDHKTPIRPPSVAAMKAARENMQAFTEEKAEEIINETRGRGRQR